MPVVLSVNGNVESYPVAPVSGRTTRIESVRASEDRQPSSGGHSIGTAQAAYEQQTRQRHRSKPAVFAQDLMTSPVTTLGSDGTFAETWEIMKLRGFRHIPVTSVDGTLVGMVSDRDLLRHAPDLILAGASGQTSHHRLAEILSPRLISATPTTDIREIARVMLEERIRAIPILDGNRRPIGILTSEDLLRGLARHSPLELWT